jgi:hypothetical protein
MAQVDWYIEGIEFSNCKCDYACPCQFESRRPTYGDCRGFASVRIDKGYFGDVTLDGGALLYAWPGPIYEGNGECQAVIDERADGRQRDALATVLYGGETNEGGDPLVGLSDDVEHCPSAAFQADRIRREHRAARIVIPGVLESTAGPIRSPATGAEHRVRIDLPNGIEFESAEIGSSTTRTTASIALDLTDTYCHFTVLR